MADFSEKFQTSEWKRKEHFILDDVNKYVCEGCGEWCPNARVHICYYLKGKEPWELPDNAYKCYCPDHYNQRRQLEQELKIILASFSVSDLDPFLQLMEQLASIPVSERAASIERLRVAAKKEYEDRSHVEWFEDDSKYE